MIMEWRWNYTVILVLLFTFLDVFFLQVLPWNSLLVSSVKPQICNSISCVSLNSSNRLGAFNPNKQQNGSFFWLIRSFNKRFAFQHVVLFRRNGRLLTKLRNHTINLRKLVKSSEKLKDLFPVLFVRIVLGMMIFMAITIPVSKSPSCKLLIFTFFFKVWYEDLQFYSELICRGTYWGESFIPWGMENNWSRICWQKLQWSKLV